MIGRKRRRQHDQGAPARPSSALEFDQLEGPECKRAGKHHALGRQAEGGQQMLTNEGPICVGMDHEQVVLERHRLG